MASTFTFSKAALWYLSPLALITARFLISGACLLAFLWYKNRSAFYIPFQDWDQFFYIMLIPFYGAFVLDNWSLQFISSSKSCLIYNLMPLISAIVAYFGFKKKITIFQWIILFFGFASLIPILKTDFVLPLPESVLTISFMLEQACLFFLLLIGIYIIWKETLTRLQWQISIFGVAFFCLIINRAHFLFPHQIIHIAYFSELVLLFSVALGAWGWLLIQQLLVEKKYSLLLVNGVGLFGAGLLSGFHLIVYWILQTTPVMIGGMMVWIIRSLKEAIVNKKYDQLVGTISGILTLAFFNFIYRFMTDLLPASKTWHPNPQDQLFSFISSVLPFMASYWISLCLYVGWLIIACHFIGYTLYGYLLKKYSATFLAFAGTTIPLIASLLGYIFLNEPVPKGFMLSFVLMTGSLLLFYSQEKEG
jgi:drug/metabolite transporter (DMT)-like permease